MAKGKTTQYLLIAFLILVFLAGIFVIFWSGFQSKPLPPVPIVSPVIVTEMPSLATTAVESVMITDLPVNNLIRDNQDSQENGPDTNSDTSSENGQDNGTEPPSPDSTKCPDLLIRKGNELLLYNTKMPEVPGKNPVHFNTLDDYIYYIKVQRYKYNQYCPVLFLQQETNAQGQDVYRMRPGPFNPQGGLPTMAEMSQAQMVSMNQLGVLGKFANPAMGTQMGPSAFNQSGPNAISLGITGAPIQQLRQTTALAHPKQVPYIDANRDDKPYNQGYYGFDPQGLYIGKYTVLDKIHNSTQLQNPQTGLSDNPMDPNWGGARFTNQKVMSGKFAKDEVSDPYSNGSFHQTSDALQGSLYTQKNNAVTDKLPNSTDKGSQKDNPMSDDWAGVDSTVKSVSAGKYAGDNLKIMTA